MNQLPNCPRCNSEYTYEDGTMFICPECASEWNHNSVQDDIIAIKDVNVNVLNDGDSDRKSVV